MSYATTQELSDYATARGITLQSNETVLLTKALDWLDLQDFKGDKTASDQANEWPRDGSDTVPANIKRAQMVAAILIDQGENLLPVIGRETQSETVGPVSVTYMPRASNKTEYQELRLLLRDYLASRMLKRV